jgi:AcrR family transcriptional regulator
VVFCLTGVISSPDVVKLTREAVVDAALALLGREGADRLTFRALAEDLKVTPMAIYKYVDNKDDLVGGVIERLQAELPIPTIDDIGCGGGWKELLADHARQLRGFLLRHRDIVRLIVTPPVVGRGSLVSLEFTARLLDMAGFTPANAATATTLYNNAVVGTVVWEILRSDYEEKVVGKDHGTRGYWKFDYGTLDRGNWPALAAIAKELGEETNDEQFELALASSLEMIRLMFGPESTR